MHALEALFTPITYTPITKTPNLGVWTSKHQTLNLHVQALEALYSAISPSSAGAPPLATLVSDEIQR